MAMTVLAGLVYIICEVYVDDILVHAENEEQFMERLRLIFEGLRRYRVTINPDKTALGMNSIELAGHQIDATGMKFKEDKLDKVTGFPLPTTMKQLRSFLGLANYFRDHVRNHSVIAQPLQQFLSGYEKRKGFHKLNWTPILVDSFEQLKEAVSNCQKLYFLDGHHPITLETDASDYGLGGYLRQVIDSKDYPIMFISKSFTSAQL